MTLIIILILVFIIALLYFIHHDKLMFIETKLEVIEEKLNSILIKRREIIKDSENEIKELVKTKKSIYQDFDEIDGKDIDMFELDKKLQVYKNEFYLILDKYEVLKNDDEFQKIAFSLSETSDKLETYRRYYNKYAESYNKAIKSFPIFFTNLIKGRKKKEFFDI